MNPYVKLLLDFVLDPLNLLVILGYFIVLVKFKNSIILRWNLLALVALTASFIEFSDYWISEPPRLVSPLQQLRAYGRPISVVLLFTFIVINKILPIGTKTYDDQYKIAGALAVLQLIIFIKNFLYGSIGAAFVAFFIFMVIIYAFRSIVPLLLNSDQQFINIVIGVLSAVLLFNAMCTYQAMFDYFPLAFTQGRFFGLTGNPQHAAVIYASSTPFMLFIAVEKKSILSKIFLGALALTSVYYLIQTGSRTGLLICVLSIGIFLIRYQRSALIWAGLASAIVFGIQNYDLVSNSGIEENTLDRYSLDHSSTNTRAAVFAIQMRQFSQNPIFGIPLRGDRLRFSENSYGAVANSVGIIGLIPMFIFVFGLLKLCKRLWKEIKYDTYRKHYYLTVVSGIVSLLIGAVLEAYLLGNLTWPLIILFIYVSMGYYLLSQKKAEYQENNEPI